MRRELLGTCVAVAVGLGTAGCASMSQTDPMDTEPGEGQQTMVEVTNNNEMLVTVEAVSAGVDRRLGQVAANNTETFTLPEAVRESDLRIQVDPIGSTESYVSPEILISEGDVVMVRVESNLDLTTVSVR